jgi:hypothetical protein
MLYSNKVTEVEIDRDSMSPQKNQIIKISLWFMINIVLLV